MSETNPNFEQDPELQATAEQLGRALAVSPPRDLADRVFQATCELLPEADLQLDAELGDLDRDLRRALAVRAPADLSHRVRQAVARSDEPMMADGVAGRIGFRRVLSRLAVAAAVALVAGAGLWLALGPDAGIPAGRGSDVDQLLLALDHPATLADPVGSQIVDLMIEVEEVASAVDGDLYGELDPVGASLEDQWTYLEQQLESF